jgi:hypothetical protein
VFSRVDEYCSIFEGGILAFAKLALFQIIVSSSKVFGFRQMFFIIRLEEKEKRGILIELAEVGLKQLITEVMVIARSLP